MNGAACGGRRKSIPPSTLVRWCRFNFVGGIGIVVQVGVLFLLKSILHFEYLAATAIAVEAAVVHNFVWHERFTWADRTKIGSARSLTAGAEAHSFMGEMFAALKRCATPKRAAQRAASQRVAARRPAAQSPPLQSPAARRPGAPNPADQGLDAQRPAAQCPHWATLRRLVRFHLSNGAVSIVGNLALMKIMVGLGSMNYLAANAIAITTCSVANFLVSEAWVFGE